MARFYRRGVSKIFMLAAIADFDVNTYPTNVTAAEITAGVDLSTQVGEIGGFEVQNEPIETPNLNDKFTPKIDGPDNVADSSLTMYDLDDSTTIRDVISKGDTGFLVLAPYGNTLNKRLEIWQVKVSGANDQWTVGNDPARYVAQFVVLSPPDQKAVRTA